jgi:hypothetical protein
VERKHVQLLDIPKLQEIALGNHGEVDSHQSQN